MTADGFLCGQPPAIDWLAHRKAACRQAAFLFAISACLVLYSARTHPRNQRSERVFS
jgi:hypothetical protein